jgi:general secretion pathway protein I
MKPAPRLMADPYRGAASDRHGLTLLEVLISVTIFFASLTAILQILSMGRQSEMMTRLQTEAILRCEAKMEEVISGVQELTSVSDETMSDPAGEEGGGSGTWQWSLQSDSTETTGLLQVTVTVNYVIPDTDPIASFSLMRYLRDPQLFLEAASTGSTP